MPRIFLKSKAELARHTVNKRTGLAGVQKSYITRLDKVGKIAWSVVDGKKAIDLQSTIEMSNIRVDLNLQQPVVKPKKMHNIDYLYDDVIYLVIDPDPDSGETWFTSREILKHCLDDSLLDFELGNDDKNGVIEFMTECLEEYFQAHKEETAYVDEIDSYLESHSL